MPVTAANWIVPRSSTVVSLKTRAAVRVDLYPQPDDLVVPADPHAVHLGSEDQRRVVSAAGKPLPGHKLDRLPHSDRALHHDPLGLRDRCHQFILGRNSPHEPSLRDCALHNTHTHLSETDGHAVVASLGLGVAPPIAPQSGQVTKQRWRASEPLRSSAPLIPAAKFPGAAERLAIPRPARIDVPAGDALHLG